MNRMIASALLAVVVSLALLGIFAIGFTFLYHFFMRGI
jgi:hypothetical protein